MSDTPLLTIDDYRHCYRQGDSKPNEVLGSLWDTLDARGCGPRGDTALIYLPTIEQRQRLLAHLASLDPSDCPLWGVPFVVKDNIDIAAWPTTAACPEFTYIAQDNATVVQALLDAGAIPVAKANLDQFATGLVGIRSPYGWVRNAFSDEHISGGSSSGSASVVARGLVPFALGTDTAGSGRVPAGFNNLVGIKPTPGRFSIKGVVPACQTIDCVSILSLTLEDGARVSRVLAATGHVASESQFQAPPQAPKFAFAKRLRVGVPADAGFTEASYKQQFEALIRELPISWDIEVVPIDMSELDAIAEQLYRGPWIAERLITARDCLERNVAGLDPTVRTIIEQGRGFSASDAFEALYSVRAHAARVANMWQSMDVLLVPTAPGLPRYTDVQVDPISANSALGKYTNFVNLLGWSALATPASFTQSGLPFGVTWIAPAGCDEALLDLGERWMQWRELPLGCHLRAAQAPVTEPQTPELAGSHRMAVVGAHLSGMPLNTQLQEAGARLAMVTTTSANYELYHIPDTTPPKPGLVRVHEGGHAIALEVYDVPAWAVSDFLLKIPSPLGLGKVELADGQWVTGFICEPSGIINAKNISAFGGWRAYMESMDT
jgi:allophanate hydrolase